MAAAVKASPPHSSASSASSASSPEPTTMAQQAQFPTPRRKGGRKPVYATQEERKMRNRAAQAAFRERRTEYIKHLEATIKHQEESLSSLQQSSRNAADEVLMLRYKNSLLERILLEKGINVAAELKAFAQYDDRSQPAAPQPIPRPMPSQGQQQQATLQQQQHMHRPMMAQPQQQQKRPSINPSPESLFIKTSPIIPPSSRNNSPSIAIPTPPDASAYQIPQSVVTTPTAPSEFQPAGIPMQNFYPSPYQAHMEELEQEYDAELLESTEDDTQSGLENQSATADGVGSEMMGGMLRGSPLQQHRIYNNNNNVRLIDPSFESMFNMEPPPPISVGGLTDVFMKQFNSPFGFATSNLR